VAAGLAGIAAPVRIMLAERDGTAIAFAAEWEKPAFAQARKQASLVRIDSASHSFAGDADYAAFRRVLLGALG
jgi:hypothetical protein